MFGVLSKKRVRIISCFAEYYRVPNIHSFGFFGTNATLIDLTPASFNKRTIYRINFQTSFFSILFFCGQLSAKNIRPINFSCKGLHESCSSSLRTGSSYIHTWTFVGNHHTESALTNRVDAWNMKVQLMLAVLRTRPRVRWGTAQDCPLRKSEGWKTPKMATLPLPNSGGYLRSTPYSQLYTNIRVESVDRNDNGSSYDSFQIIKLRPPRPVLMAWKGRRVSG